jgi:hypothetical protein
VQFCDRCRRSLIASVANNSRDSLYQGVSAGAGPEQRLVECYVLFEPGNFIVINIFADLAALLAFMHRVFIAFNFIPGLIHFLLLVFFQACRHWKMEKSGAYAI